MATHGLFKCKTVILKGKMGKTTLSSIWEGGLLITLNGFCGWLRGLQFRVIGQMGLSTFIHMTLIHKKDQKQAFVGAFDVSHLV